MGSRRSQPGGNCTACRAGEARPRDRGPRCARRSGWCPWLARSPSASRAALCILTCLLWSPASVTKGRHSAVRSPQGPTPSSVASGTPHRPAPAEGSAARGDQPFPSGLRAPTECIPLWGQEGGRFRFSWLTRPRSDRCLRRRRRLGCCTCYTAARFAREGASLGY